eukprot:scaffold307061_cov21-Tisochrysis_lutea.AAC.1
MVMVMTVCLPPFLEGDGNDDGWPAAVLCFFSTLVCRFLGSWAGNLNSCPLVECGVGWSSFQGCMKALEMKCALTYAF